MSYFLNSAGKDLFHKHLQQYSPPDPLYEYTTDTKGHKKRSKRPPPPGLSKNDIKILKSVQTRAHHLDKSFSLCGIRFGWSFLLALIPVAGSVADAFLNYLLVIRKARQANIPHWLESRMVFNSALSVALSFIPIVGDIFVAVWKANSRNAVLLEEFLRIRGEEWLKTESERESERETRERNRREERLQSTSVTEAEVEYNESERQRGFFARWRGRRPSSHSSQKQKHKEVDSGPRTPPSACPVEQEHEHDDLPAPSSIGHASTSNEGGDGSSRKKSRSVGDLFGSLGRKSVEKAPPAGEKGRFVEHVPEADYERWRSPPVQ